MDIGEGLFIGLTEAGENISSKALYSLWLQRTRRSIRVGVAGASCSHMAGVFQELVQTVLLAI